MNDHFRPVANPAPPRPRWPEAFTSLMIALVTSQAPRRLAPSRPQSCWPYRFLKIRSLSASISCVSLWASLAAPVERGIGKRCWPTERGRIDAVDLRTGLGHLACRKVVDDPRQRIRRKILVIIGIDLNHWRVHAGAETFDFDPGKRTVGGDVILLADHAAANLFQFLGAAQHAWRRATKLDVKATDRREIKHRVKGRHLKHANFWHAEQFRSRLDRFLRQPPAALLRARHKTGMTAECWRPSGYFATCAFAQDRLSGVNAKLAGCFSANRRTLIDRPRRIRYRWSRARLRCRPACDRGRESPWPANGQSPESGSCTCTVCCCSRRLDRRRTRPLAPRPRHRPRRPGL